MRQVAPITILGWDGTGPMPDIPDLWDIVIPKARAHFGADFHTDNLQLTPYGQSPHPQFRWSVDRVQEYLCAWLAAKEHNELVPHANRYAETDAACHRATTHASELYDDLHKNTTINWLAAHHRFVLACIAARDILTTRAELAAELAARDTNILQPTNQSLYALHYTAHVPQEQRIQLPTKNTAAEAQATLDDFVALCTRRFETLRATITGTFPPGFAPTMPDVTAEWNGDNIPVSPALAYADQAMRIPGPRAGDEAAHVRNW